MQGGKRCSSNFRTEVKIKRSYVISSFTVNRDSSLRQAPGDIAGRKITGALEKPFAASAHARDEVAQQRDREDEEEQKSLDAVGLRAGSAVQAGRGIAD